MDRGQDCSTTEEWAAYRRSILAGRYWISPDGPRPRWKHDVFSRLLRVFGGVLRLTPLLARGVRNSLDLRLTELELAPKGWPAAFDGYRILHVTDTHLDILPAIAEAAAAMLDGIEVDLLALTGDVHGWARNPIHQSVEPLARALGGVRVRERRLAILGNHDPVEMIAALEPLGFETLVNRTTALVRDGVTVHVTGLDDVHDFYSLAARRALDARQDGFRVALVHSPEMADHAAAAGCGLYLSGHTHGGQICRPNGRPIFTQLVRCRHAASGVWRQGDMVGYTSPGLGVSPPMVRFNCRGGAALITLRCGENDR
ncbi:MAG: metallophosphoesterase [Reyranella sp.]|uniref:metallophosphoesterase n=1 Tax=Reyranella sp. TaxID=1929291 RepID=UPI001AC6940C|nr:metallophosphoesterase [Reyranella sp.]MBN9086767.1 metallophosphoesterase [Reyranella sp.]